jgi:anti-sigma regulatory factor (Ser/Thr protein kinase)
MAGQGRALSGAAREGSPRADGTPGFRHLAYLYESPEELAGEAARFIGDGLAESDDVLVAVPERNAQLIRFEVGEAEGVDFIDMEEVGRNPACIIPVWQRFVADSLARGRTPRGIGEPIWPGRGPAEIVECERHEALLNLAFPGRPEWTLLCPYDASRLPDAVIAHASHTHPHVATAEGVGASARYAAPRGPEVAFGGWFPSPPPDAAQLSFGPADLAAARNLVSEQALRFGLGLTRAADLVVAANELATNSIRHGGGSGELRVWSEGGAVLCEVRDSGSFSDPLAGRRFPPPDHPDGRGLWIVNHLCDLVQVRSSGSGSAVRVFFGQAAIE